tara:strand:- start:1177 stop:2304 length:1128 start_codon:yes stop_codon:yes gene_type:complete
MAKKFNRDGSFFAGDAQHTGQEPTWEDYDKLTEEEKKKRLQDGLYFYSYYCDFDDLKKDFKTYALKYFKPEDVKFVLRWHKKAAKTLFTSAKLARMVNRGLPENEHNLKHFKKNFLDTLEDCKIYSLWTKDDTEEDKPKAAVISPTKRLENKCNEKVLSHMEETIDNMLCGHEYKEINATELVGANNIPAKGCELIMKALHTEVTFYEEIKSGQCDQLVEAYDWLGKREINKIIKTVNDWICDIEKYRQSIKKTVVRVKKVKPAGTQVKDLKFDKDNSTVAAHKIPGAVECIIFNSKYRKLQVYYAIGRSGLSVKGTTIKDFDDVKSYQVTVRQNLVEDILSKDPKQVDKFFGPKTKRAKVNGRVNEHCRIVYVK